MNEHSYAEQARNYAIRKYIEPSRRRHDSIVRIPVSDVHRSLGLVNRFPLVCNALRSQKFLRENNLLLEPSREGPPSGLGSRVVLIYRLGGEGQNTAHAEDSLLSSRGLLKDVFESLGGGEAFIRKERENFHGPGEDA